MHILFCVNNIKFGTKCFVKVEQFVLPFIEFHKNSTSGDYQKLGNATDANRGNVLKIDWTKYAKVTDEGELNICVGVEGTNYGTAGIHCCKSLGQMWAQNVTRIYPGMRIEMKVRLGGNRTGFVPMIEVKNPAINLYT